MSGNRPLDDRERKRFTYFSSLSPMARKIMQDKEKIREKYGPEWARLPPAQQDEIIDRCLVGPRAQRATDAGDPARFPGLRGPTGQKLVRFGDEDITWQDEHSAPFSWETRSQMEFSISSLSIQEPGTATMTSDPRPLAKAPQGTQAAKPAQSSRSSSLDALGPSRKEEEASFWKINAERSREGPEAEFQSLTPSQIKSMEKGEKVMAACYRQEPITKDKEVKAIPQEQQTLSSVSTEQEVPQPVQAPASLLPKATPIESPEKSSPPAAQQDEEDDALFSEPVFSQISSSNTLLKTGFDFLDNWSWGSGSSHLLVVSKLGQMHLETGGCRCRASWLCSEMPKARDDSNGRRKMSESSSKSSQPLASKQEKDGTEKRGRGRPRKQPPKEPSEVPTPKRPRGRPKGSKNKGAAKTQKATRAPGRKPRGRPKKLEKEEEKGISQESSEEKQ
ncbi:hypothetical protein NN561_015260 [Cricetulus griseus]